MEGILTAFIDIGKIEFDRQTEIDSFQRRSEALTR
jgi:hypothetical protein